MATRLTRLARTEADLADWSAAEQHLKEAVELTAKAGAQGDMARTLLLLGSMRLTQGDWAAAEQHLGDALELARRVQTPGQRKLIARVLAHLGQVALEQGATKQALSLHLEALELRSGRHKRGGLDVANSLLHLAQVANALGDWRSAEAQLKRAQVIHNKLLSVDSIPNATAARIRAQSQLGAGQLDQALEQAENAVDIWQRIGTLNHPEYAQALATLAETRLAQGDANNARSALRESIAISERVQPQHPLTTERRERLAALMLDSDR